jgi:hypothetical protein
MFARVAEVDREAHNQAGGLDLPLVVFFLAAAIETLERETKNPTRNTGAWGTLVSFQPSEFQQRYPPAVGCRKEKRTRARATRPSLLQRRAPRH